jgi:hypothetical protein
LCGCEENILLLPKKWARTIKKLFGCPEKSVRLTRNWTDEKIFYASQKFCCCSEKFMRISKNCAGQLILCDSQKIVPASEILCFCRENGFRHRKKLCGGP